MPDVVASASIVIDAELEPFLNDLSAAAARLNSDVGGAAQETARIAERALTLAFGHIADTIADAAVTGEFSFRGMVNAILRDLSRLAIQEFIQTPIRTALGNLFSGLIGGAAGGRAAGGPVQPHRAFVVGERGPELFVPAVSGAIAPRGTIGGAPIVFNITTPDAQSFLRAESQVAAMALRALGRGRRNM